MLAFSLRTTSPHRGPALLTHKWIFTIINVEALVRKIFSINFRPTLNVGRTFFVFKVRSFKQKAVSRTPSIHVRGELKPLMLAGPFLFSKSGVLNKKRSLAPLPIKSGVRLNYLKRHRLVRDFLRKFEFRKFGNFCFSEFSNEFPKIWKFLFSQILVTIRKMKRRVYMPSTGHVTRLFHTTAAALRARQPGAAAQKRNRRAAATRRRSAHTKPPHGGGPAPRDRERERERIRTVRRRVYVL